MSAAEEHLATRRSAGLFDFSFMGLYEFHGKSELQSLQTHERMLFAEKTIALASQLCRSMTRNAAGRVPPRCSQRLNFHP